MSLSSNYDNHGASDAEVRVLLAAAQTTITRLETALADEQQGNDDLRVSWQQAEANVKALDGELRAFNTITKAQGEKIAQLQSQLYNVTKRAEQAEARAARLEKTLRRTLSWLTSYPGEGGMGMYEEAKRALEEYLPVKQEIVQQAPKPWRVSQ